MTEYVRVALTSPVGVPQGLAATGVPQARIALPEGPIGQISALAGPYVLQGRVSLPSPLGVTLAVCEPVFQVLGSLPSPLGVTKVKAASLGDDWGYAGFPLPRLQSYQYSRDAGLQRTEMYSGGVRQRRRWTNGRRTASVSFDITTSQLYAMESFLAEKGYSWFNMALVTGDRPSSLPSLHTVRVKDSPQFGEMYADNMAVSLTIEIADQ